MEFNFVGDVRDDLHGFAEIIPAALLGENRFVNAAGRPIIVAAQLRVREAFVVDLDRGLFQRRLR